MIGYENNVHKETWGFCLPCSSPRKCDLQRDQHCYTFKAGRPCSQQPVMVKYECCLDILSLVPACRLQPQPTQQGQWAQEGEKQHRVAVSVLGQCSQYLLCSLLQSLRVAWSFRREGLIWLQWQLCVLGVKALATTDTSGFVASFKSNVSALSERVIYVYRYGIEYSILDHWWY